MTTCPRCQSPTHDSMPTCPACGLPLAQRGIWLELPLQAPEIRPSLPLEGRVEQLESLVDELRFYVGILRDQVEFEGRLRMELTRRVDRLEARLARRPPAGR